MFNRLTAKRQASGREADDRRCRTPVPLSDTLLGAAAGVVGDGEGTGAAPSAVGVKVTVNAQLALAARWSPRRCWFARKSPLMLVPLMLRLALPVLEASPSERRWWCSIAGCQNARLVGERLTTGAAATPVPLRATLWGLPLALSVMVRVPVRAPSTVGVKVTVSAQLALAASVCRAGVGLREVAADAGSANAKAGPCCRCWSGSPSA